MTLPQAKFELTATDKTSQAFASAKRHLNDLSRAFGGIKAQLAGLVGAVGFGALIKSSIDTASRIKDLSIRIGASTETLSRLMHVAKLSGVEFESLVSSLEKMQRNISQATLGTSNAGKALAALGINVDEFKKLALDKELFVLTEAFQHVTNASDRTNLAMAIMSKGGGAALQVMEGGVTKLKAAFHEADRLGLTLSQTAANTLDDAGDAITTLENAVTGLGFALATTLAPAIKSVSEVLIESVAFIREHADALLTLGKVVAAGGALYIGMQAIPALIGAAIAAFSALNVSITAAVTSLGSLKAAGLALFALFTGWEIGSWIYRNFVEVRVFALEAIGTIHKGWEYLKYGVQTIVAAITYIWQAAIDKLKAAFASFIEFVAAGLSKIPGMTEQALKVNHFALSLRSGQTALTDFKAKMVELNAQHTQAIQTINQNVNALAQHERTTQVAKEATEQHSRIANRASFDLSKMAAGQSKVNKELEEAKRITEEMRTPQEVYADNIAKIDGLLSKGLITLETHSRATKKYAKEMQDALKQLNKEGNKDFESLQRAVEGWGKSFTDTLADMLQGKKTFSDLIDSIVNDIARIGIQRGITDPIVNSLFGAPGSSNPGLLGGLFSGGEDGSSGSLLSGVGDFFSGLFGFAKGGVMTNRGAIPLRAYAGGGIANSPQMALFGEGALPEAYVPLPDGRSIPVSFKNEKQDQQSTVMRVEVINQTSTEAKASRVSTNYTPEGLVTKILLEDLRRGGPIASGLSNTYGLKRDVR